MPILWRSDYQTYQHLQIMYRYNTLEIDLLISASSNIGGTNIVSFDTRLQKEAILLCNTPPVHHAHNISISTAIGKKYRQTEVQH